MSRRRFYAPPENIDEAMLTADLPEDEARHLREVLRLGIGDEVYLFDGAGREWRGVVTQSTKRGAQVALAEAVAPAQPESPLALTLAVALLKGDKFDFVVQKATELGVTRLQPLATQYADVRLRDARDATQRVTRWQRIALAAAKQSGRAVVPEVCGCLAFSDFLAIAGTDAGNRFMFAERAGQTLADALHQSSVPSLSACVLVGAEGGWADSEIARAQADGWRIVTLGGRILRAETAAIVAVTLLQHTLGDLR